MRFDIAKGNKSGFVRKILYVEGESVDFMSECLGGERLGRA